MSDLGFGALSVLEGTGMAANEEDDAKKLKIYKMTSALL